MRILIISSYSESLINFRGDLLNAFKNRGHQVVTLGPDNNGVFEERLKMLGCTYRAYYLNRTGLNPFNDLSSIKSLLKIIREEKPDLVLSYTIKPVIYGSIAASWAGVPHIYSMITGLGWAFNPPVSLKQRIIQSIVKKLYAYALRKNKAVIFQNPDDQNDFIKNEIVSPDITHRVYGSGVDLNHYTYFLPSTNPISFVFMGRFVRDKGIVEFIRACNQIYLNYPNTRFHLVGWSDTNPSAISADMINELDNNQCITNHGQLDDVRQILSDASVFVLPSYREGTPRTALEAMAMGRPLIMADTPGCRETVVESENGFLVPAKDAAALAAAMEKFIINPDLVVVMGKKSRQIAEELYDVHRVNADILRIMGLNE